MAVQRSGSNYLDSTSAANLYKNLVYIGLLTQSFSVLTINKIGNSEGNSNSRFRRFDKNTFVRFMKVVGNSQLGKEIILNSRFFTFYLKQVFIL